MLYGFDDFVIDMHRFELRHQDERITIEPRVFNLLAHFAANPHQVFSIDELIDAVWEGRLVSDSTIASCVKNARKAIRDTDTSRRYLETVRGRGYRFNADIVTTESAQTGTSAGTGESPDSDPTLIILPFRCLSDTPTIQHAVAGISIDLGSILTRVPLLKQSVEASRYIAREIQPTAREVHEDLGVDFVLDGTSQEMGDRIRTNVQLANARTGMRVWAETFDNTLSDSDWQTNCVHSVVGKLEPQLHRAMHRDLASKGGGETARQLFLEATSLLINNGWNHEAYPRALELLRKSQALNPGFALAPSLNSMLLGFGNRIGLIIRSDESKAEALESAETALLIDNMDSTVLGLTGCCLADIGYAERGEALLRNAIDMNTANAQAWVGLGATRLDQGDVSDALEKLSYGINISPMDSRLSIWGAVHAIALLHSGDSEGACTVAENACRRHDKTYPARVALAGARLAKGDYANAKSAISEARRIKPDLNEKQVTRLIGKKLYAGLTKLDRS